MAASISCFGLLFVAHDVYDSPSVKTKMSCPELPLFTLQHSLTSAQVLSCWNLEFLNIFHRWPLKCNVNEIFLFFLLFGKGQNQTRSVSALHVQHILCSAPSSAVVQRNSSSRKWVKLFHGATCSLWCHDHTLVYFYLIRHTLPGHCPQYRAKCLFMGEQKHSKMSPDQVDFWFKPNMHSSQMLLF